MTRCMCEGRRAQCAYAARTWMTTRITTTAAPTATYPACPQPRPSTSQPTSASTHVAPMATHSRPIAAEALAQSPR